MQNVDNKREREKVMVSVHCYQPQMREQIRQVMRYSGPRMLFHHPVMAIRHLIDCLLYTSDAADE